MRLFRIIPVTIVTAVLFLVLKMFDLSGGADNASRGLLIENVKAEQTGESGASKMPSAEEAKAETAKASEAKETKKEGEGGGEGGEGEGEGKKEEKNPHVSDTPGDLTDRHYSQSEMDLLQKLSARRDELDRWERNIQIKEEVLNATEKRVNDRIAQIEAMKQQVADLLAQYNAKEDAKIHSLVKIYENMKPKDAARIFDEVEMPILLLVIDKMSEKKAAPILAQMDPKKAKQLTVELAEQRRYNAAKLNMSEPPATAKATP